MSSNLFAFFVRPLALSGCLLLACKYIVHRLQGVCKLFFTRFYRQFCVFVCFLDSCIVMQHNARFCWCRCCRLRELNHRRRVKRFKPCLRLRLRCWLACVFALVFAPLHSVKTPSAVAVAVCAVVYARARDSLYTQGGDRVLKVPRRGGVSHLRTILINSYSKTQTIHLPVERAGIRGQRWGEWVQKDP